MEWDAYDFAPRLAVWIAEYNLQKTREGKRAERISRRSLARKTGLAATTLERLEKGDSSRFDKHTLRVLCVFFEKELVNFGRMDCDYQKIWG